MAVVLCHDEHRSLNAWSWPYKSCGCGWSQTSRKLDMLQEAAARNKPEPRRETLSPFSFPLALSTDKALHGASIQGTNVYRSSSIVREKAMICGFATIDAI